MVPLARKNLLHDKVRLAAALVGIAFAVVLTTVQVGLLLRFLVNASVLIDGCEADIWITSKNVSNFEYALPFSERKLHQVRSVAGIEWVEKYILAFSYWKLPDGGQQAIEVIGYNPETLVGAPPRVAQGDVRETKYFNSVLIDLGDRRLLGNPAIGDHIEINGRKARVVGFTEGARSFTGTPFVFTSFKNALELSFVEPGNTVFLLAKVAQGFSVADVKRRLQDRLRGVDVATKEEFSWESRIFWLLSTGAGVALLSTAALGLLIGTVVVGQTVYASTVEHSREYGTLKAIGASNRQVQRVIVEQAALTAVAGVAAGLALTYLVTRFVRRFGLETLLPGPVVAGVALLVVAVCVASSVVSMWKVVRIDPALIFKG